MHEKWSKIDFFANFRKLQKKPRICKKRYGKILNVARAVVTSVEKKVKPIIRIFFTSAKVAPDCKLLINIRTFQRNQSSNNWKISFCFGGIVKL